EVALRHARRLRGKATVGCEFYHCQPGGDGENVKEGQRQDHEGTAPSRHVTAPLPLSTHQRATSLYMGTPCVDGLAHGSRKTIHCSAQGAEDILDFDVTIEKIGRASCRERE